MLTAARIIPEQPYPGDVRTEAPGLIGAPCVLGALRLDLLEAFLGLAEELHFTRAAERLYLSQSGLSRRIGALECLLGCCLFDRSTRTVELTAAGRALLPHARAMLAAADAAAAAVLGVRQGRASAALLAPGL